MEKKIDILKLVEQEVDAYGYNDFSEITETDDRVVVSFDVDNDFCDASIIYDISRIIQDTVDDICNILNISLASELADLPLIKAEHGKIEVHFLKKDFENIVE